MIKHTTYKDSVITNEASPENQTLVKILLAGSTIILAISLYKTPRIELVSPCPTSGCIPITPIITPTPSPTATPSATPKPVKTASISGLASYYSRAGCIGCSATLTMSNGQPLDDSKLTVAYNRAPLNSRVTITNQNNGKSVIAMVTDRGGFERHGKIVDLSVATKNALGCGDVCRVEIYH